jgi:hypothetical protein
MFELFDDTLLIADLLSSNLGGLYDFTLYGLFNSVIFFSVNYTYSSFILLLSILTSSYFTSYCSIFYTYYLVFYCYNYINYY